MTPSLYFCTHESEVIMKLKGSISFGSFPSPRLIRLTLLSQSPTATLYFVCESLHPQSCNFSANFCQISFHFLKLYSHLAPYLNISILPVTQLCVCALFRPVFIEFSCQNVTKTALTALWMQPLAKRDVMTILRDKDYPF